MCLQSAQAQFFKKHIADAPLIIEGEVVRKEVQWSADQRMVYTINWVKPKILFKGKLDQQLIPVLTKGGATDDGLMVVSHALQLDKGYDYLLALGYCNTCISGNAYLPGQAVGAFAKKIYAGEKQYLLEHTHPEMAGMENCNFTFTGQAGQKDNDALLSYQFSNIYMNDDLDTAYIDLQFKTDTFPKTLYSFKASISSDSSSIIDAILLNEQTTLSLIPESANAAYQVKKEKLTNYAARLELIKNNIFGSGIVVDTLFRSALRIIFPTTLLVNITDNYLDAPLQIDSVEAAYVCGGQVKPFSQIIFHPREIGLDIGELATGIVYSFGEIYRWQDELRFSIFATSDEENVVTKFVYGKIYIDFSTLAFLPNQVMEGATITELPGGSAGPYSGFIFDEDANTVDIIIDAPGATINPTGLADIRGDQQTKLCEVRFKVDDCTENMNLSFDEPKMQTNSFYLDMMTFMNRIAYDPVVAFDQVLYPICGCEKPDIMSFTPDEIVAGDDQVLTIQGEHFGVFEKGDPEDDGDKSSVLFYNGDYASNAPAAKEFIAAAQEDFMIAGVLEWTDTKIQVKVPSTDYFMGVKGPASTGKFIVRNACNKEDQSGSNLKIPYALLNFRLGDESVAKRLGLRNDNGSSGEQDGYEFEFHPNVNVFNIDIKDAFDEGLSVWCDATNIRFKKKADEAPVGTLADARDGKNIIVVGSLGNPDAQAALIVSQFYFSIDCGGSDIENEDGGYILTDLDFVVDNNFASGNDQARAERVFTHELGHAHMLNHARCFGFLCGGPLMHPQATTGTKDVDIAGGNEIFVDSETIINNGCVQDNVAIFPVAIKTGNCGIVVSANELETNEIQVQVIPNPTYESIRVKAANKAAKLQYQLSDSNGKVMGIGIIISDNQNLDLSHYPSGIYYLSIASENGMGYFKIVKL